MSISRSEFLRLDGDSRIKILLDLVKLCSYQQQLQFVDVLNEHLHKDFISLLPNNLVERVLFFLSVEDAVNCTLVNKKWNHVVGACISYWNKKAEDLGLTKTLIAKQMKTSTFSCLKDLCVSAVYQQKCIKSLVVRRSVVSKSSSGVTSNFIYAGRGVTLRYSERNGFAQVIIDRIISPCSLVEIATFGVKPFSGKIKWSSSSDDYVLWKQQDGKWNGYDITSLEGELEQWVDEPISQGFHSISFCWSCHLIAILSEAEDDMEVWDLQVIKVNKGKATIRKMVYPLPLERVQQKKRYLLGGDITLFSDSAEKDETGFCQSHRIFVQVDAKLVIYQLKAVPMSERLLLVHHLLPDARLSKPLHVICPEILEQPFPLADLQISKGYPYFCYSFDYSHVALLQESYLYIWKLDGYEEESCVDLLFFKFPPDCKCIAVGSMYTVLASNSHGMCYVVLSRTGELLLQTSSAEPCFNHEAHHSACFDFFGPVNQQWLTDLKLFDFWPMATVIDKCKKENELKVLVGTRNHSVSMAKTN